MKRILVIGASGAGKSTLARRLSDHLQLPVFPSDFFYWEPGWKISSSDRVRQQVRAVVCREAWILDGNFDDEHDFVWKQADCIIWLDYSLPTILKQVLVRNLRWVVTRQPTWSGNTMTLQRAMPGIWHAIKSYSLKRDKYPRWLAGLSGVTIYRFGTKQETETWFQDLD